jgi:hypothetical protein
MSVDHLYLAKPIEVRPNATSIDLHFVAIVNNVLDGPLNIYADPRCPKVGAGYPHYPRFFASDFNWKGKGEINESGIGGKWKWELIVTYRLERQAKR